MKKISFLVLTFIFILSLTSCDNNATYQSSSPVIIYNNDSILDKAGTVADVVDATYDSVVSIRADINENSYNMGSGMFISSDSTLNLSYILTCYHVIDGASSYSVTLSDQSTVLPAKLVGGDPTNDIALLSVDGTTYNCATIDNSSDLQLGSQVVIIGNPLGTLPGSITSGYVSYINRNVVSEDYRTMSLIQTDASINSGNSGGAMFDMAGRLVGVVNAKYVDEGVEGLGFAIPIDTAMDVVNSILKTSTYSNGTWTTKGYYVGSYEFAFTLTDMVQSIFGNTSIVVSGVSNNSTASGYNNFQIYDQINSVSYTKADGTTHNVEFTSSQTLMQQLYNSGLEIGDTITINIIRNRAARDITFEIVQFIPE